MALQINKKKINYNLKEILTTIKISNNQTFIIQSLEKDVTRQITITHPGIMCH